MTTQQPARRVVDLMAALEESVRLAKEARVRRDAERAAARTVVEVTPDDWDRLVDEGAALIIVPDQESGDHADPD